MEENQGYCSIQNAAKEFNVSEKWLRELLEDNNLICVDNNDDDAISDADMDMFRSLVGMFQDEDRLAAQNIEQCVAQNDGDISLWSSTVSKVLKGRGKKERRYSETLKDWMKKLNNAETALSVSAEVKDKQIELLKQALREKWTLIDAEEGAVEADLGSLYCTIDTRTLAYCVRYNELCRAEGVAEEYDQAKAETLLHEIRERYRRSDMERRIEIFLAALREKKGLTDVENDLRSRGLRKIYLRSLTELCLAFALECNEEQNDPPYDIDSFRELLEEMTRFCYHERKKRKEKIEVQSDDKTAVKNDDKIKVKSEGKTGVKSEEKNKLSNRSGKKAMTLGELRTQVIALSKYGENRVYSAETASNTLEIEETFFDSIDFEKGPHTAKDGLKKVISTYSATMTEGSLSLRFYVLKELYFVICHQICELKFILSHMMDLDMREFTKWIEEVNTLGKWSLCNTIYEGLLQYVLSHMEGLNVKEFTKWIGGKNSSEDGLRGNTILGGINKFYTNERDDLEEQNGELVPLPPKYKEQILTLLFQNFLLTGEEQVPSGEEPKNHLFVREIGPGQVEKVSISQFRERRDIFGDKRKYKDLAKREGDKMLVKHDRLKGVILQLKIEDFYNFSISYGKCAELLFDKLWSQTGSKFDHVEIAGFISDVLQGVSDLGRTNFLTYLCNCKGVMRRPEWLISNVKFYQEEKEFLSYSRVNQMLKRVGYVALNDSHGKDFENLDKFYKKMFTLDRSKLADLDTKWIGEFQTEMDTARSVMEIGQKSSWKSRMPLKE